jgi:hypothetical protein
MVIERLWLVAARPVGVSVTCTVKLVVPVVVGVPDKIPPAESVRPAGREPLAGTQLYAVPPNAERLVE